MNEPGQAPRLRLVIPCYNEADRLDPEAFIDFARSHDDSRLLFVDDGSTDDTAGILAGIASRSDGRAEVLTLPRNAGKVAAVQRGVLAALDMGPELVGYWDSDLSTPLDVVQDFLSIFDGNTRVDIVMGSRVKLLGREIERSEARHYIGRVFATAASLALRLGVYDTQCGAKIFRVNDAVVRAFSVPFRSSWVFDVELLARYIEYVGRDEARRRIFELPLKKWVHVTGSKVRPHHGFRAALDLLRIALKYRS